MAAAASREFLGLYRSILRAHRQRLPPALRRLGDDFVRFEFRQHRTADPQFIPPFLEKWSGYLATLESTKDGQVPGPTTDITEDLNEHQAAQLRRLSERIRDL